MPEYVETEPWILGIFALILASIMVVSGFLVGGDGIGIGIAFGLFLVWGALRCFYKER